MSNRFFESLATPKYHQLNEFHQSILSLYESISASLACLICPFVSDFQGRINLYLICAFIASISSFAKISPDFNRLAIGFCLGGIGASQLTPLLEAWMITFIRKHHQSFNYSNSIDTLTFQLATSFGYFALVQPLSIIVVESLVEDAVEDFGVLVPFKASVALFMTLIWTVWYALEENYHVSSCSQTTWIWNRNLQKVASSFVEVVKSVFPEKKILLIFAIQLVFEWVLFAVETTWRPLFSKLHTEAEELAPLTELLKIFTLSRILGVLCYLAMIRRNWFVEVVLFKALFMASFSFVAIVSMKVHPFGYSLALSLFYFSTGLYYPALATMYAQNIPETTRAGVLGVFRIPSNFFKFIKARFLIEHDSWQIFVPLAVALAFTTALHALAVFFDQIELQGLKPCLVVPSQWFCGSPKGTKCWNTRLVVVFKLLCLVFMKLVTGEEKHPSFAARCPAPSPFDRQTKSCASRPTYCMLHDSQGLSELAGFNESAEPSTYPPNSDTSYGHSQQDFDIYQQTPSALDYLQQHHMHQLQLQQESYFQSHPQLPLESTLADPVQAYAKIEGRDFTYFVRKLVVILGRKVSQTDVVDVHLGNIKSISRNVSRISLCPNCT
ncbi:Molybdate-anion transporter [Entophlyctis sp. JEL0112]|nr:Molybdate-anion transporter [Entophlyctis sp. JEL0112]